ncbi:small acid-soluble spore protein Tlp [Falsibacillus albus]|uniref:Small, acid-soluble spore protein Tlp n=1 Tax=Falsibacillus albus TaxID=2478915 RepID=A0A3L7K0P9_9BACI|nr:small acid-soluble spore protein Tlp [Falsibacillus albus]RLQ96165.1 small acid-soluble spore protein Tlp [Falsibacillus albus]
MTRNTPNPDNRNDNVEKLQDMVQNTIENMEKAEASMEFSESVQQTEQIKAKNERRRESIQAMRDEMKDEAQARKSGFRDDQNSYQ